MAQPVCKTGARAGRFDPYRPHRISRFAKVRRSRSAGNGQPDFPQDLRRFDSDLRHGLVLRWIGRPGSQPGLRGFDSRRGHHFSPWKAMRTGVRHRLENGRSSGRGMGVGTSAFRQVSPGNRGTRAVSARTRRGFPCGHGGGGDGFQVGAGTPTTGRVCRDRGVLHLDQDGRAGCGRGRGDGRVITSRWLGSGRPRGIRGGSGRGRWRSPGTRLPVCASAFRTLRRR